ncbi:hypothetical protein [Streptomyces sp. NPDC059271]|uniref:hypothetical protein n=1 Tax=Streptomyces sp. NPDC059271 TaxID=3346799 RepID=UPI003696C3D2
MNSTTKNLASLTELFRNTGPILCIALGAILLLLGIVVIALGARSERQNPSATEKSLDAKVFVAILVFALALVLFGTETARITGIGVLVATVSAAWFRRGQVRTQDAARRDKGHFKATFKGIEWQRSWDSTGTPPEDEQAAS